MTMKFIRVVKVVERHVGEKFHQRIRAAVYEFYRVENLFALSRNGEKSENLVFCPDAHPDHH